jgi:hypothetical protein
MALVDMYNKHMMFHCHAMQKRFQETAKLFGFYGKGYLISVVCSVKICITDM